MSEKQIVKLVGGIVIAIIVLVIGLSAFYTVESGEKGVIKTFGKVSNVVGDGLHFKIPFVQDVTMVNVKTQKAHAPASAGTKDMQQVHTEVALNFRLDQDKLDVIYSATGLSVEENIIDPRIQEVVKAVIAKYSAEQLLSMREQVKGEVERSLRESVTPYHIIVEGIQITNFEFTAAFNQAIESKQIAEQSAQKAKNDLDRIRIEAEQQIATARGEAETIRIQADAIRAQGGKEYVQMKAIEKWNGQLPTYMGGSAPMPFIDVK